MAKVSLRAYNREIEAMIDRNHLEEAVAHCQHILKIFPKHLETYRLLGKAYLEAKRHNEAVDIFSRVLAAEPNDFVAHVGMSIVRDEQSKLDDAIWHMERAYEVQSANPAIQSELQRLYGRRDGVQPPHIRMTRGALAHMYMRGELYPQAISETKSVLEEDQGRSDMQVLLAKAFYRSGQKKDAADAASAVLKRYPFCLEANLVLAEILGTDRPESAHGYRQRVVELDPYAAQVADSMFRAAEVSDAAVSLEHLEWNGQPVGMSTDWGTERAISLESGVRDRETQPDWLKESFPSETPPPLSAPTFGSEPMTSSTPAQPADDIPDFLRAAGWGASTGSFDESRSSAMFDDQPAPAAEPLAQGDLPDWVKAMAPQGTSQPEGEQEEEIPDWINKIGTGDLPVPSAASSDQPDWLSGLGEEPSSSTTSTEESDWMKGVGEEIPASQPSDEQSDWMKGFAQEEQPASAMDDQPDWMKGFEEQPASKATEEQPDWMKGFGEEQPASQPAAEESDWIKGFGQEEQPASKATEEQSDWMKDFGSEAESVPSAQPSNDFDFLDELTREPAEPSSASISTPKIDTGSLGTSSQEQDDSFAWLENLAAKQGATEGLLTKPEERLEDEPDWIKQAKGLGQPTSQLSVEQQPVQEPVVPEPAPQPTANVEDLGKSGQEIDDALAWFESLAAKQGATEGLLTKPEERLEQEPDWVKKVKGAGNAQKPVPAQPTPVESAVEPPPVSHPAPVQEIPVQQQPPMETPPPAVSQPAPKIEDLGKSSQEIDDALAWFESLAVKQGATEGLLTKPEERLEQEPEWVKQVKKSTGELQPPPTQKESVQQPVEEVPVPPVPQPAVNVEDLGKSSQEIDDALAWFESLAVKQGATEGLLTKPEERQEQEPEWVKLVKKSTGELQPPPSQPTPVESAVEPPPALEEEFTPEPEPLVEISPVEDVASWLKGLDEGEGEPEPVMEDETTSWLKSLDEPEEEPITFASASEDLPAWMQGVSEEQAPEIESALPMEEPQKPVESPVPVVESASEEMPSWLSSLEEEEPTAPVIPAAEDLPAWMRDETGEVVAEPTKIEPTRATDWTPVDEEKAEAVQPPLPAPQPAPAPKVESKPAPKAKKSASKKEEVKMAAPPEPYREPVTRRGTGMVAMPVDPILGAARAELSRSNIPGALETYEKLIKKGRFLEEVIYDLREALYRYPVEVSIWQTLGDAYMRSNQLQDALDAYTKAEELLR